VFDADKLKRNCRLDPNELDVAALEQADLYAEWATAAAEAKATEEAAKTEKEITEAKLAAQVRADPGEYGIEKTSEAAITSHVKTLPEYARVHRNYNTAMREAALLVAAERALQQRKAMIEELGRLHGAQYFAGPDVPRDLIEIWKHRRERVAETVLRKQQAGARKPRRLAPEDDDD
jgi:hypothetical protein